MRVVAINCTALLVSAALLACGGVGDRVEPTPAPEEGDLVDLSGAPLDLDAHVGRDVVLLAFWATDCPSCEHALRFADALHVAYADAGLHVLAVAPAPAERGREEAARLGLTVPMAVDDGAVADAWNPDGITPAVVLLDRDGGIAWRSEGFSLARAGSLEVEVRRLVAPTP